MVDHGGAEGGGPYRRGDERARFVCIVCCASLSVGPGRCRRCGVERLALDAPDVEGQLRAEAEKRLQRRAYREYVLLSLAGSVIAGPPMFFFFPLAAFLFPVAAVACAKLYSRINQHSALAIFSARRRRISRELGTDVQISEAPYGDPPGRAPLTPLVRDADLAPGVEPDPSTLALPALLSWLGARIEE